MTDRKQRLAALADRIEQLQGPDREVDAEIAKAVGATNTETVVYAAGSPFIEHSADAYTASLDTAMTLVPEGMWRRVNIDPNGRANVRLGNACAVTAATPALALCAAALRAQSETVA